jgi:hypothetical protein
VRRWTRTVSGRPSIAELATIGMWPPARTRAIRLVAGAGRSPRAPVHPPRAARTRGATPAPTDGRKPRPPSSVAPAQIFKTLATADEPDGPRRRPGRSRAGPQAPCGRLRSGGRALMSRRRPDGGDEVRDRRDQSARLATAAPGGRGRVCLEPRDRLRLGRPPRLQLEIAPGDLVRLCSALSTPIARDHGRDDTEPSGWHTGSAPRQHRRQAQQKNAAPHGRTLSQHRVSHLVTPGSAPSDPNPGPSRPDAPSDHDLEGRHPPAAGGMTHRHRVPPRDVPAERRQGSCEYTKAAPAGVLQSASAAGRSQHRVRTRSRARRGEPEPRGGGRDEGRDRRRPVRLEHRQLHLQREEVRVAGPLVRGQRGRDLQPERDLVEGQGGRPGREGPHVPRSWQRHPSPYGSFSQYTKDGMGLNKTAGTATRTRSTGRVLHEDLPQASRPTPWSS